MIDHQAEAFTDSYTCQVNVMSYYCSYCQNFVEKLAIAFVLLTIVHRHDSEVMGCASLYTQLLAIVRTFKHLQLTFNEFVLLRCDALLNAG